MLDSLTLLESAFEQDGLQCWPMDTALAGLVERLVASGIALEGPFARSLLCEDCLTSHRPEQLANGEWWMICEAGSRVIARDELRRWRVDPAGLIGFLRAELSLSDRVDERITDSFWYLGQCDLRAGEFPIWLLRYERMAGGMALVQNSLQNRPPDQAGIVLVADARAADLVWPRGSKSLRLADLISESKVGISINKAALIQTAPETAKPPGRPGRPKKSRLDAKVIFRERVQAGLALQTAISDEARAIRVIEIDEVGRDSARAAGTIESTIRDDYTRWKEAGFDPSALVPRNS